MTTLTEAIAAIPTQSADDFERLDRGTWTDAQLREFLDKNAIKYRRTDKGEHIQYDLTVCPLCNHSEGNPAVWLHNGHPCFKCFWADPGCSDLPKKTFRD